jgi:hypothetical protein
MCGPGDSQSGHMLALALSVTASRHLKKGSPADSPLIGPPANMVVFEPQKRLQKSSVYLPSEN